MFWQSAIGATQSPDLVMATRMVLRRTVQASMRAVSREGFVPGPKTTTQPPFVSFARFSSGGKEQTLPMEPNPEPGVQLGSVFPWTHQKL